MPVPLQNIGEFKDRLAAIKKEHPKATHHCFAYRIGLDGNSYRSAAALALQMSPLVQKQVEKEFLIRGYKKRSLTTRSLLPGV